MIANDLSKTPIHTAGVVVFDGDAVLLVRHEKESRQQLGMHGLPAGRIEQDESELQTAIRELEEETGLRVEAGDLIRLAETPGDILNLKEGPRYCTFAVFVAKKWNGDVQKKETKVTPDWIHMRELAAVEMLPNVHWAIKEAQKLVKRRACIEKRLFLC